MRGRTDPVIVNKYARAMAAGERFPPLGVATLDGALILYDGFHRAAASELVGIDEVEAIVTPCESLEELLWLGFDANLRHGQPLKSKRAREAFQAFIRAGRHRSGARLKSYREWAQELPGFSYSTLRRWAEQDFPELFAEMGGGGAAGKGGIADRPAREAILATEAEAHIIEAGALMAGVSCPHRKAAVASKLREVLLLIDPQESKLLVSALAWSPD